MTVPLVDLADVKDQLNIPASNTDDDAEIMRYILAATEVVNRECGVTAPTVYTETVAGRADASGRATIVLSKTPVMSVTSIGSQLAGLPSYDLSFVVINNDAGIVYLSNWFAFYGPLTVTYTAGRSSSPQILETACAMIVQDMWATQRGGAVAVPGVDVESGGPSDYGLTSQALQMLRMGPYRAAPGIA